MGFMEDKVTPAQGFLQVFRFYSLSYHCTFPLCLYLSATAHNTDGSD